MLPMEELVPICIPTPQGEVRRLVVLELVGLVLDETLVVPSELVPVIGVEVEVVENLVVVQ